MYSSYIHYVFSYIPLAHITPRQTLCDYIPLAHITPRQTLCDYIPLAHITPRQTLCDSCKSIVGGNAKADFV